MRRVFYIVANTGSNGEIDLQDHGRDILVYEEAVRQARDIVNEHGGVQYVIRCMVERKMIAMGKK